MCIFWFMLTTFCNYSSCPKTISNLFYIRTFLISIMNLGGLTLFVGARVLLIGFRLMFITNKVQKIGYQNKSWNVYMQIYQHSYALVHSLMVYLLFCVASSFTSPVHRTAHSIVSTGSSLWHCMKPMMSPADLIS